MTGCVLVNIDYWRPHQQVLIVRVCDFGLHLPRSNIPTDSSTLTFDFICHCTRNSRSHGLLTGRRGGVEDGSSPQQVFISVDPHALHRRRCLQLLTRLLHSVLSSVMSAERALVIRHSLWPVSAKRRQRGACPTACAVWCQILPDRLELSPLSLTQWSGPARERQRSYLRHHA